MAGRLYFYLLEPQCRHFALGCGSKYQVVSPHGTFIIYYDSGFNFYIGDSSEEGYRFLGCYDLETWESDPDLLNLPVLEIGKIAMFSRYDRIKEEIITTHIGPVQSVTPMEKLN